MKDCVDLEGNMATDLLDDNEDLIQFYMLNYTPLIFINNHLYKGNFDDTLHLVEALCMTFEEPPAECSKLDIFTDYHNFSTSSLWKFISYTILYLFLIFAVVITIFYFFYKRSMKKKIDNELESRINGAIKKYYGQSEVTSGLKGMGNTDFNPNLTEEEAKIGEENNK